MKFNVTKASDMLSVSTMDRVEEIELNTLEEFLTWVEKNGDDPNGIILSKDENGWNIEIYDDYVG